MLDAFVWDIETGPNEYAAEFIEQPKPPAQIKKPETLAKWEKEEKPELLKEALEKACLSPLTGRVLTIGVLEPQIDEPIFFEGEEGELLLTFYEYYVRRRSSHAYATWVGFGSNKFDLPFIAARAMILSAGKFMSRCFNDRHYPIDIFVDLRDIWCMGDRYAKGSLGTICKLCGIGEKSGSGKNYADLYKSNRDKALEYLANDLLLTRGLAEHMLK